MPLISIPPPRPLVQDRLAPTRSQLVLLLLSRPNLTGSMSARARAMRPLILGLDPSSQTTAPLPHQRGPPNLPPLIAPLWKALHFLRWQWIPRRLTASSQQPLEACIAASRMAQEASFGCERP